MSWFSIFASADVAHIRIRGEIAIGFRGDPTLSDFRRELGDATKVELHLDCLGGDYHTALEIFRLLCVRETVCTIFRAHSAASVIAMAARHTSMFASGSFMIHSPVSAICAGPGDLRDEAEKLERLAIPLIEIFSKRTGKAVHTVKEWFRQDTYFSAEQALANRLIDQIVPEPEQSKGAMPPLLIPVRRQTESEVLFFDILKAIGKIQTRDRARFARNLGAWFNQNVYEVEGCKDAGPQIKTRQKRF